MGQYYYAVSSLPHLSFESEVYPSREEFMQLCAENLSASDLKILKYMDELGGDAAGSGLLKQWFEWNLSLRFELATLRAQKLRIDLEGSQGIGKMSGTEEVAREAFSQESPIDAEEAIERGRWGVLEELEVGHFFDLEKLLVYGMKISILERKAQFELESGLANFKSIYSAVTEGKIGEQPE